MKELLESKNTPDSLWKIIRNETPFRVIKFGPYELRLYWVSLNSVYGAQVQAVAYGSHGFCWRYKTSGCGYCKESHAMEWFWRECGYHPRANSYLHDTINHQYHVGGNFYRVPNRDILKNKKRG